jgi:hypothetical protein
MTVHEARLIRMLGCPTGDCRDMAADMLHAQGWDAARALIWGTWTRNVSIRSRSEGLLAQLACPWCMGTGLCSICGGLYQSPWTEHEWCQFGEKRWMATPEYDGGTICLCAECNGTGQPHPRGSSPR